MTVPTKAKIYFCRLGQQEIASRARRFLDKNAMTKRGSPQC